MKFACLCPKKDGSGLGVMEDNIDFLSERYKILDNDNRILEPYFLWVQKGITYRIFQGSVNLPDIFYQTDESKTVLFSYTNRMSEMFEETNILERSPILTDSVIHELIGNNPLISHVHVNSFDFSGTPITFSLPVSIFINCHEGTEI